ncbi:PREDICTED: uncharacterized protein LOC106792185 [Polistes canadensis]|uniref:uncharacterized protein LOC106792185 n=1 Tax=Polistes canadensis TaxID=91411 RepID=UPI000718CC6A|nr:PREDICTED: uncharacterized protein LOC106792185 [Polistes canadensis]
MATATNSMYTFENESKGDPEVFVRNIRGLALINGWDETKMMYVFWMALRGEAENWVNSRGELGSLEELIREFLDRFVGKTLVLLIIKELAKMKYDPRESILAFLDKMAGMSRRVNLSKDVLVALCLNALPDEMGKMILLNAQGTLIWTNIYQACSNIRNCKTQGQTDVMTVGVKPQYKKKDWRNEICYTCGQKGHIAKNCEQGYLAKQRRKASINEIAIKESNGEGSNKESSTYLFVNYISSCVELEVKINGREVRALVDSGSQVNIINSRLVKGLECERTDISLRTADGSDLDTLSCITVEICMDDRRIKVKFYVSRKVNVDCILGIPFLKDNKITMEFGEKCAVSFPKEEQTGLGVHRIRTTLEMPICTPLYKLGLQGEGAASGIVQGYLKDGIIRYSNSPWRSPVVMVPKKDGSFRLCVDYRRLNDITIRDAYPMPRTDEFFDALKGAKIFSKLDAKSGYHQIDMHPEDIEKTAFGCKEGLFEFVKMPFGLVNGPATFQRVLRDFINKFVVVYMDDILIFSKTQEEHEVHVRTVLNRLKDRGKHFESIKNKLADNVRLTIPNPKERFILTTDASNTGVGAILAQVHEGKERVIAFYSALHSGAESRYSTTEQELLAVIKAIQHFGGYLLLGEFTLRTDHSALKFLFTSRNIKARLARGATNGSDHLSREFNCININVRNRKSVTPEKGQNLIVFYHDLLGHGSIQNVKYHVLSKYVWAGAGKDIEEYVKKCVICQRADGPRRQYDCSPLMVTEKNDLWEVDIVGPFEENEEGYKYILTMVDHRTKWAEVVPLRYKSMSEVRDGIEKQLIGKHGRPREILSDNGKEFDNREVKEMCKEYDISWKHSSPYNPTTTGLVERFNKTLVGKLRKITEYGKFDWGSNVIKIKILTDYGDHGWTASQ